MFVVKFSNPSRGKEVCQFLIETDQHSLDLLKIGLVSFKLVSFKHVRSHTKSTLVLTEFHIENNL